MCRTEKIYFAGGHFNKIDVAKIYLQVEMGGRFHDVPHYIM